MTTRSRRLFKLALVLGVVIAAADTLLRAMGAAANHGGWDGER